MGTLANPSNVSNQMFLSYALVEWSVVAYLAADAYVFVHIKLGSWLSDVEGKSATQPLPRSTQPRSTPGADEGRRATIVGCAAAPRLRV